MHDYALAFLLTLIAGMSTGIGSLIAFLSRHTDRRFLTISLGFSAGVMVYVSMVEIFSQAKEALAGALGLWGGSWAAALAFFGGIGLIALIGRCFPENSAPLPEGGGNAGGLLRTGLLTASAIAVHNFPEGLATFVSALQEPGIAIPIVVAIAIHNIPEGIAVSTPIYQATGSKKKAFWFSFLSGLAEQAGALIDWALLLPVLNQAVFGVLLAAVAGIMVFISIDELLPAARDCGAHHLSIAGFVGGMGVMAFSLLLFL